MNKNTIQCMEINNAYDSRLWNANTEKRTRQIVNNRSRRIKKLAIHAALKGIGLGLLYAAAVIEPAYGNIAVNLLYGVAGVGLVILG